MYGVHTYICTWQGVQKSGWIKCIMVIPDGNWVKMKEMIGLRYSYEHTFWIYFLKQVRHGLQHQLQSNHFVKILVGRVSLVGSWAMWDVRCPLSLPCLLTGSPRQTEQVYVHVQVLKCLSWQAGTSLSQSILLSILLYICIIIYTPSRICKSKSWKYPPH